MCATTPWGLWSECSVSCGEGVMIRNRRFLERLGRKKCPHITTTERKPCSQPECGLEEPTREIVSISATNIRVSTVCRLLYSMCRISFQCIWFFHLYV